MQILGQDSIECVDSKNHSKTRGTYLLDDVEVESLKNHPKVKFVDIDVSTYDERNYFVSNALNNNIRFINL